MLHLGLSIHSLLFLALNYAKEMHYSLKKCPGAILHQSPTEPCHIITEALHAITPIKEKVFCIFHVFHNFFGSAKF